MGRWVRGARRVRESMDAVGALLSDEQALAVPAFYMPWKPDTVYAQDAVMEHEGLLYRVAAAGGVTSQAHQPPGGTGMLAVYRPITAGGQGSGDSPALFVCGMDVKHGDIVLWQGQLYRWLQGDGIALWEPGAPGTAALWELVGAAG